MSTVEVEYCGERYRARPDRPLLIGREGDCQVDDNPYLHRHFLRIEKAGELWWLVNLGSQLTATVSDPSGAVQAQLGPGARLPLVFADVSVMFSAGPTTYELRVLSSGPAYTAPVGAAPSGDTTIAPLALTATQRMLLVALAEPILRRNGTGSSAVPPSAEAAARLGWPLTTFNRKLDNVCDKLTRAGVRGLRGDQGRLASNRRARLVEHAVASRLVTRDDLALLPVAATAT